MDGRVARADAVTTDSLTLEGIDTTDTKRYPAGTGGAAACAASRTGRRFRRSWNRPARAANSSSTTIPSWKTPATNARSRPRAARGRSP
ncbi:phage tail tube protein [Achromobacter dolens]|uniref:phage tail tube protein n=1 Tax=Achromobacter dolens TaxID=1287738 RepID=UPI003BA2C5D3